MKHIRNLFKACFILSISMIFIQASCKKENPEPDPNPDPDPIVDYRQFSSFKDFNQTIEMLANLEDSQERETRINAFWDSLKVNKQIPFVMGDSVAFLYKGTASSASWAGDFNGWNPGYAGYQGEKIGQSTLFRIIKSYPSNARLDYKIVLNGNSWQLDPANPHQQYSGFGPNSELRMPLWEFPQETIPVEGLNPGSLSENILIQSKPENLNYQVQYKVYLPYNYESLSNLGVIYITDGHEYADHRLGAMKIVLDNLIHQNRIHPVVAVFIDPRNPSNLGQNRRMDEYRANIKFARFVAEELVPHIDNTYNTNASPQHRAILGTSLGGWNSAYFGYTHPSVFGLIGIHSPAFDNAIITNYSNAPLLPLKVYMSTGVIFDTQNQARAMRDIMIQKGYPLLYKEVNEGHSWGNWRALIDEPLIYFFGK